MTRESRSRREFIRVAAASPLLLPLTNPASRTMADETRAKQGKRI
ncbi:MAG TPA: hypothetical protein VG406_26790 [Isosphaeraceae bacterium]|jgi:hypothetical protein|nr:hypothetical protein [Isosphaeraceae bacterium]